jgi:hypothetical protein
MSFFDAAIYGTAEYTYMLLVGTGTQYGKHARMMTTLTVKAGESNTLVALSENSASLDFQATLDKLTPTPIPQGKATVDFDWTEMKTNAMNHPADPYLILKVMIASFDLPVSELQKDSNFLKLEKLAVNSWSNTELAGTHVALSSLVDKNGSAFTGIDSTHTWILALENTDSMNPAPWYITVLKACKE